MELGGTKVKFKDESVLVMSSIVWRTICFSGLSSSCLLRGIL